MADKTILKRRLEVASSLLSEAKKVKAEVGNEWEDKKKQSPHLDFDFMEECYNTYENKVDELQGKQCALEAEIEQRKMDNVAERAMDKLDEIKKIEALGGLADNILETE